MVFSRRGEEGVGAVTGVARPVLDDAETGVEAGALLVEASAVAVGAAIEGAVTATVDRLKGLAAAAAAAVRVLVESTVGLVR